VNFYCCKETQTEYPRDTKEAFEKGLKFMSRLDNNNMVCMAGICYGNTPYIIMKYMDEFSTSSYLKKLKVVTSTESELQSEDQIQPAPWFIWLRRLLML